jgi:hypothetical protein
MSHTPYIYIIIVVVMVEMSLNKILNIYWIRFPDLIMASHIYSLHGAAKTRSDTGTSDRLRFCPHFAMEHNIQHKKFDMITGSKTFLIQGNS